MKSGDMRCREVNDGKERCIYGLGHSCDYHRFDSEVVANLGEADVGDKVAAAFRRSERWLIVCEGADDGGSFGRVGPFESEDDAQDYASQCIDGKYDVVGMTDVRVHSDFMFEGMKAFSERLDYERTLKPTSLRDGREQL